MFRVLLSKKANSHDSINRSDERQKEHRITNWPDRGSKGLDDGPQGRGLFEQPDSSQHAHSPHGVYCRFSIAVSVQGIHNIYANIYTHIHSYLHSIDYSIIRNGVCQRFIPLQQPLHHPLVYTAGNVPARDACQNQRSPAGKSAPHADTKEKATTIVSKTLHASSQNSRKK